MVHLRTAEGTTDKVSRAKVDLYTDVSGLVEVEADWMQPFVRKCMAAGITSPAWVQMERAEHDPEYRPGRRVDLLANLGFQLEGDDLVLADKAVASEAMTESFTRASSALPISPAF